MVKNTLSAWRRIPLRFIAWLWSLLRSYLLLSGLAINTLCVLAVIYAIKSGPFWIADRVEQLGGLIERQNTHLGEFVKGYAENIRGTDNTASGSDVRDAFHYVPRTIPLGDRFGYGRTLKVGPQHELKLPSDAAKVARDGDIVEIEPGFYAGDSTVWAANNLVIRGNGGIAHLDATGIRLVQDKAIWVITGDHVRVENMEFSGAKSSDANGAGIRAESADLYVVGCFFHDNESGLLSSYTKRDAILSVEYSEFARNGHSNGAAHQIYVANIARFNLRFSYFHDAFVGSNVKSRARDNRILYNEIVDGAKGSSNYSIDLSEGGVAYVIGNVIEQGPLTENYHVIAFAPENQAKPKHELFVVHNTIANDRRDGVFIWNNTPSPAYIYNNLLLGDGKIMRGTGILVGNMMERRSQWWQKDDDTFGGEVGSHGNKQVESAGIVSRSEYDYHLRADSPAINAGVNLEENEDQVLSPEYEYQHPSSGIKREITLQPDIGAFEFQPPPGAGL